MWLSAWQIGLPHLVQQHFPLCPSQCAPLQDPSGQIHAAVHRSVLEEEPSFAVGATVMLQQVTGGQVVARRSCRVVVVVKPLWRVRSIR